MDTAAVLHSIPCTDDGDVGQLTNHEFVERAKTHRWELMRNKFGVPFAITWTGEWLLDRKTEPVAC